MNNRDFGFIALGRWLAVERYIELHQPSSTHRPRNPGPDRTCGHADKAGVVLHLGVGASAHPTGR